VALFLFLATTTVAAESDDPPSSNKLEIQFDNTERLSSYNSMLEAVDTASGGGADLDLGPISFIISKADMGSGGSAAAVNAANNYSTVPIIMPAAAQLTEPEDEKVIVSKRKKNFSKLAKTIMLATKNLLKKKNGTNAEEEGDAEAVVSTTEPPTTTTVTVPFNIDTYCQYKDDDTYPDRTDCQNFVICYAGKAFKTVCAAGTFYSHANKDCDYEAKGKK
jgi:hypothetical protein